ncbi:MAG: cytochrome c [Myxococcales bacterium]|nr:cytochrome c [Myxococcales bacterium]MDH5306230.1 cytochrome c [Myxococcales bacterium]MDH5567660.1 cytochrome c [Myxococcales bacterium]
MRQRRLALACVAIIAVVVTSASVAGAKSTIKEFMGENFAGMHTILVALITSNYASVPAQAAVIRDHAEQLTELVPDRAKNERDQFLSYAYNLKSHAQDLKVIAELLIKHDQEKKDGDLSTDQLREALAAHYGGMVTTCVACHNRYRPQIIR